MSDTTREAAMSREDALQKAMGLIRDANQALPVQAYASDVRALRRLLELLAETEQRLAEMTAKYERLMVFIGDASPKSVKVYQESEATLRRVPELETKVQQLEAITKNVQHCENCGGVWYDGGLNEPACPWCRIAALREQVRTAFEAGWIKRSELLGNDTYVGSMELAWNTHLTGKYLFDQQHHQQQEPRP